MRLAFEIKLLLAPLYPQHPVHISMAMTHSQLSSMTAEILLLKTNPGSFQLPSS